MKVSSGHGAAMLSHRRMESKESRPGFGSDQPFSEARGGVWQQTLRYDSNFITDFHQRPGSRARHR